MKNFNQLTIAESERLAWLAEELGEATQRVGKILRHGYESHHPNRPNTTNRKELETELGDVSAAIQFMFSRGDLERQRVYARTCYKLDTVWQFLWHNKRKKNEVFSHQG